MILVKALFLLWRALANFWGAGQARASVFTAGQWPKNQQLHSNVYSYRCC